MMYNVKEVYIINQYPIRINVFYENTKNKM